jgi:hypothetical protein
LRTQGPGIAKGTCTGTNGLPQLDRGMEGSMYFVAAVLTVLSGLFYAASHHEIGSLGMQMCEYGSTFCDKPHYVLTGGILAALWGGFVSIR